MNSSRIKNITFLFLLIFVVIYHFFGFQGHFGWDDMEYARLAKQWADGSFDLLSTNHFTYRWTIVGFTGLAYKFFGMSDFSSALPSMLVTIISLGIIYWITRKLSTWVSVMAMTLFALNHWTLFYSDKIMTDSYVALALLGAVATIWNYRFEMKGRYTLLHALFFVGFLFFGFVSKETIYLITPLGLFVLISDLVQKRNIRFWIYSAAIGIIVLMGYFYLLYIKTGNPWIRFEAISQNSYVNPCRYDLLPFNDLFARISYQLWGEMIKQAMLIGFIFIIPVLFFTRFRELLKMPCSESFFITIATMALLCSNFMSTSFSAYVPMCLDVRHYLYVSPLIALAAAPYVVKFFQFREGRKSIPLISVLFAIIAIWAGSINLWLVVPLILLIRVFLPAILPVKLTRVFLILFVLIFLFQGIANIIINRDSQFDKIGPFIKSHFSQSKENNVVITDPILKRFSDYYMEFDTLKTRFVSYYDAPNYKFSTNDHVYFILNDYTWWLSEIAPERMPLFMKDFRDSLYQVIDSTKNMKLIDAHLSGNLLVYGKEAKFNNGFEYDALSGWNMWPGALVKEKYFTGLRTNKIDGQGYSATLILPLNQLISDSTNYVDAALSGAVFLTDSAEGQMVISLENTNGKSLAWLGKHLRLDCKKSNEWSRFGWWNRILLPAGLDKDSTLFKVFIWNDHAKPIYIDDLEVTFRCINHL